MAIRCQQNGAHFLISMWVKHLSGIRRGRCTNRQCCRPTPGRCLLGKTISRGVARPSSRTASQRALIPQDCSLKWKSRPEHSADASSASPPRTFPADAARTHSMCHSCHTVQLAAAHTVQLSSSPSSHLHRRRPTQATSWSCQMLRLTNTSAANEQDAH